MPNFSCISIFRGWGRHTRLRPKRRGMLARGARMKISVVGLGKLGSPIVAVLAAKGYDVIGIDTNPLFVDKINQHDAPVEKPLLQESKTERFIQAHIESTQHRNTCTQTASIAY